MSSDEEKKAAGKRGQAGQVQPGNALSIGSISVSGYSMNLLPVRMNRMDRKAVGAGLSKNIRFQSVFNNSTCEIQVENRSELGENKFTGGKPTTS